MKFYPHAGPIITRTKT